MADLLGPLSIVADLGFGLPPQQAMRSALVSAAMARHLGLDEEELRAALYVPLLMHIGCISMSHETAAIFGNELAVTRAVALTNLGDPRDIVDTLIPEMTRGLTGSEAEQATETILTQAPTFGKQYDTASSEVARQSARRMGLDSLVQQGVYELSEAWQGDSAPMGLKGEEISLVARIGRLASDAAFFDHVGGPDLAVRAVAARAGTLLDPELARVFEREAPTLLEDANHDEPVERLLVAEPKPFLEVDASAVLEVAAAIGNAADLKMPYTHGHSGATARIAAEAARRVGLPQEAIEQVTLASYLHDVGRVAISNAVWEKAGKLNSNEWEQVHVHPYHGERILLRSKTLEPTARDAAMHHERLDGSGYHRGCRAVEISLTARIIAVADAWVSMQQPRPHRAALEADRAAAELRTEAREGRFDPVAVDAVLEAAGHAPPAGPVSPGGLSRREIEVLRLVAAGRSNPEIAQLLHISRRTAEHHVQHIYTKIGVATRPGAALFALENGLLEPIGA